MNRGYTDQVGRVGIRARREQQFDDLQFLAGLGCVGLPAFQQASAHRRQIHWTGSTGHRANLRVGNGFP